MDKDNQAFNVILHARVQQFLFQGFLMFRVHDEYLIFFLFMIRFTLHFEL